MNQHLAKISVALFFMITIAGSSLAQSPEPATAKDQVLRVLKAKCNFCHRVQNPDKVFNAHNMEEYQAKIYQQVFIFRRMPKGKTELTETERQALLSWVKLK
ncbi:hypothetical protein LVD17_20605 [Fulvivirga ulvae]|uniref:hypothetical protein n=1 Tax=Fulvivirga ulvae TaxID=2904245 RepID=UPI001F1B436B|nr:hypothetical protein [Fulvivirga ulvae]UII30698.1 hypothetical protein LVD17_20605 [Fulvivirga ulvae]